MNMANIGVNTGGEASTYQSNCSKIELIKRENQELEKSIESVEKQIGQLKSLIAFLKGESLPSEVHLPPE